MVVVEVIGVEEEGDVVIGLVVDVVVLFFVVGVC